MEPRIFEDGGLRIDYYAQRVYVDGEEILLPATQYHILEYLSRHAEKPVTPHELLTAIWGTPLYDPGLARWHISHLRRNIGDVPPKRITHRRGYGYTLRLTDGD